MYNTAAGERHFMVRPDWTRGGVPMSYAAPIATDYWDNNDDDEFATIYKHIKGEGVVLQS